MEDIKPFICRLSYQVSELAKQLLHFLSCADCWQIWPIFGHNACLVDSQTLTVDLLTYISQFPYTKTSLSSSCQQIRSIKLCNLRTYARLASWSSSFWFVWKGISTSMQTTANSEWTSRSYEEGAIRAMLKTPTIDSQQSSPMPHMIGLF